MGKLTKGNRSLEGRIALVTGAGSGMGRATAYVLADEGVQVALFDLNEAGLGETVDAIKGAGGRVKGWTVDLAEPGAAVPRTDGRRGPRRRLKLGTAISRSTHHTSLEGEAWGS